MKHKLEAREDWPIIEDDMMGTLKAIKEITHNCQTSKHCIGTVSKTIKDFFTVEQEDNKPTVQFAKRCRTCKELMEDRFGKLDMEQDIKLTPECIKLCDNKGNLKSTNKTEAEKLFESSHQCLTGCNYLQASSLDKTCSTDEEHPFPLTKLRTKTMKTMTMTPSKTESPSLKCHPDWMGKTFNNDTCNKCKKKGHHANQCPNPHNTSDANATDNNNDNNNQELPPEDKASQTGSTKQGTGHLQMSRWNLFNVAIIKASHFLDFSQLMRDLPLLDNQSTDDIFCNNKCSIGIQGKQIRQRINDIINKNIIRIRWRLHHINRINGTAQQHHQ